jgi:hypothetical protein
MQRRAFLNIVTLALAAGLGLADGSRNQDQPDDTDLDTLVAFARLVGYVRYFHPSDESAAADWDAFTIGAVKKLGKHRSAEERAAALQKTFRPLAPTIEVFPTGKPPTAPGKVEPPVGAARLLIWRHLGVPPVGTKDKYSSARIDLKKEAPWPRPPKEKIPLPDPAQPFEADLAGGVSVRLPLALCADADRTLPRGGPTEPLPPDFRPSGKDRATRLAAVILAWNAMQHFYPYFDVVETDWPAALRDALARAREDADEAAFTATLRRLVAGLHDGHGYAILKDTPPSFFLPVRWTWVNEQPIVAAVSAEGSRGIKPGDLIVKIDGRTVPETMAARAPEMSAATKLSARRAAVGSLALGPKDSEITMQLQTGTDQPRMVTLRRTLTPAQFIKLPGEPRPAPVAELKDGIWYVDVTRANEKEFTDALPQLAKARGFVFDLRGYPRISLTAPLSNLTEKAIEGSPLFLPVVLYPDRKWMGFLQGRNLGIEPAQPLLRAKTVFLTDARAISAAETFLVIVQHFKLGTIIGEPTAGTNGNVRVVELPGGYEIRFTGIKVVNYDGSQHHGRGIQPDLLVRRTRQGVAAGRDEVLEEALSFLRGRKP